MSNLILDTKLSKKEFNRMIDSVEDLSESIGKDRIKGEIQKIKKQKIHWFYDPVTQDMEDLTPYETGLCVFLHESKIFVLSGSKAQVEEVYNRVSNSGEKSGLNHNKKYQQTFDELGESQARIFLNFEEGIQSLQKFRKERNSNSTKSIWSHNGRFNQWSGVEWTGTIGSWIGCTQRKFF